MKNIAYLALGSNVGDKQKFIYEAIKRIHNCNKNEIIKISSLYETLPMGAKGQGNYINAVIEIVTELTPIELFNFIKQVEKDIGRIDRGRWNSREIDIDILFYDQLIIENEIVSIPHKQLHLRDFVMTPLIEIEPDFFHPVLKKKICNICIKENEQFVLSKMKEKIIIKEGDVVLS